MMLIDCFFFFSSRRRHTRCSRDWSSDVCSSDLPRPVIVAARDAEADALRSEGFKTSNLREAAAEAGIDEKFVERALAERGLRPLPKRQEKPERRPTNVIHDVTNKPAFLGIQPSELHYEM